MNLIDIIVAVKNAASKELNDISSSLQGLDKAAKVASGGLSILAGGFALQQGAKFAADMAMLNTQMERSRFSFEYFSGGAAQAEANMRAVQRAGGGMLSQIDAQNIAVTAMTQKLATNSTELERMVRIARGIVIVSPIIKDLDQAFTQLGLTIANKSMMRLDQLGTSAKEIKPKIDALRAANKDLSEEQAFQIAVLETLEGKFDGLTTAAINQASGVEELRRAWKDYRVEMARYFEWVNTVGSAAVGALDKGTTFEIGKKLAEDMPTGVTRAQREIVLEIQKLLNDPFNLKVPSMNMLGYNPQTVDQVAKLTEQYMLLGDAAVAAREKALGQDPMLSTDEDIAAAEALEQKAKEMQEKIDKSMHTLAMNAAADVYSFTGNADEATKAYDSMYESLDNFVRVQQDYGHDKEFILGLLSEEATRVQAVEDVYQDRAKSAQEALDKEAEALQYVVDQSAALQDELGRTIDSLAKAQMIKVFEDTGNVDAAQQAYDNASRALWDYTRSAEAAKLDVEDLISLLPSLSETMFAGASASEVFAIGLNKVLGVMSSIAGIQGAVAGGINDFIGKVARMMDSTEMSLFSIGASNGQGVLGGQSFVENAMPEVQKMIGLWTSLGADLDQINQVLLPDYISGLRAANDELYKTESTAKSTSNEFSSLKSKINSVIGSAIGPVAGVDANDLLPREDAVNENARRLADIAVNGLKNQSWLEEFKNEVPEIWKQIEESGDPKGTAARILKDFQDGLAPELLDKDRAKELVKRAILGEEKTKTLVDEIAGELASELGISLSEAKQKATEVLGGDSSSGTPGVKVTPQLDNTQVQGLATTFTDSFVGEIEGSDLGSRISGAINTQIIANLALLEASGKTGGEAFVKGVTSALDEIPAAFINSVASLVTPVVQANINTANPRTGASEY